jgi:hypothetical protein
MFLKNQQVAAERMAVAMMVLRMMRMRMIPACRIHQSNSPAAGGEAGEAKQQEVRAAAAAGAEGVERGGGMRAVPMRLAVQKLTSWKRGWTLHRAASLSFA